jgi:hypothetical protein
MNELKQDIISLYTSILSSISVLKLKAETVTFTNAQYKIGENDFLNGKGDINTLSTLKTMKIQTFNDYETTRSIINRDILMLETLTNTPIISKKQ